MGNLLNLQPVSEQEVTEKNIPLDQLWLVEATGDILGPFYEEDLREYAQNDDSYFQSARVCSVADGQWQSFFECAPFQRRRPQIVDAASFDPNESFFYIKSGQKHGPVSFDQIQEMVTSGELKKHDQFCARGAKWLKVYQHPEFDRRNTENELPFKKPNDDSFMQSNLELIQGPISNHDEDALVGLAYIGHKKDKGFTQDYDVHNSFNFVKEESDSNWKDFFKSKAISYSAGVAFVLVSVFVFFGTSSKTQTASRKVANVVKTKVSSPAPRKVVEQTVTKKVVPRFKNTVRRRSPIRRTSFSYRPKARKRVVTHNKPKHTSKRQSASADPQDPSNDPRDEYRDDYVKSYDDREPEDHIDDLAKEMDERNNEPSFEENNDF
jgi:hypothetical protein